MIPHGDWNTADQGAEADCFLCLILEEEFHEKSFEMVELGMKTSSIQHLAQHVATFILLEELPASNTKQAKLEFLTWAMLFSVLAVQVIEQA